MNRQPPMMQDPQLDAVFDELFAHDDLEVVIGNALRQAFDEVIDGPRTGRFRIEQLEKTEKTYIGTKVEIVVRDQLDLTRGEILDNLIAGQEVDTKFSLSGAWMIPREAFGHLCLLIQGNDNTGLVSAGLLRMTNDVLTGGQNQDGKKCVSAAGRKRIRWLFADEPMPRNFLLDLDDNTRTAVLSPPSGKQRIAALFKNVTGVVIPRTAILQVAQLKGDPLRRARETKAPLAEQGYEVLCSAYMADRQKMTLHGFSGLKDDDWVSIATRVRKR